MARGSPACDGHALDTKTMKATLAQRAVARRRTMTFHAHRQSRPAPRQKAALASPRADVFSLMAFTSKFLGLQQNLWVRISE
jgi:hypothetical protein